MRETGDNKIREENKNNFKPYRKRDNKDKYMPLDMTCLSLGYFSDLEKQKLRESLIGKEAERLGKTLANLEPELTVTQLRKFFNEVRSLEELMKEDNFQKALIDMLKSKVAFSVAKKTSKVPEEFKDFIFACVDKINDEKDFYGFSKFFESIVGYFYYFKEINISKREESK
jgi:CRISPR type III-A-associated protein Csm2